MFKREVKALAEHPDCCNRGNSTSWPISPKSGAAIGGSAILTEFNELLANPEQYSCVYRDGEIFCDLISLVLG